MLKNICINKANHCSEMYSDSLLCLPLWIGISQKQAGSRVIVILRNAY